MSSKSGNPEGGGDLDTGAGVTGIAENLENRSAERDSVTALDTPLRSSGITRLDGHAGSALSTQAALAA
jgi:hypothetical protein